MIYAVVAFYTLLGIGTFGWLMSLKEPAVALLRKPPPVPGVYTELNEQLSRGSNYVGYV